LQRYGEKKLQGPFYNFWKWLGLYLELFSKIRGSSWEFMDRDLISQKAWGLTAKLAGIFLVSDLFSNGKLPWTRSMAHEPWVALDHGGHRTEEAVLAHRSSYSQLVRAMEAHREVGETKKSSLGFGSDLHRSLYNGEEAARRRWSFGSGWRHCGHDEDQEEES
jgi:hypothetical protein